MSFEKREEKLPEGGFRVVESTGGGLAHQEVDGHMYAARHLDEPTADALVEKLNNPPQES